MLGVLLALLPSRPAQAADAAEATATASLTASFYDMRDQPDFWVGVAALDRGALRLEMRYNYEARDAVSLFAGRRFEGRLGEVGWDAVPLVGGLFGSARGLVPAVEASVTWRTLDAYVEAEYVHDLRDRDDSYLYAWSEIGWSPLEWLRIGIAGQRTRTVDTGRDVQAGVFAQASIGRATLSVYAFNPDQAARYLIFSLGIDWEALAGPRGSEGGPSRGTGLAARRYAPP